MKKYTSFIVCLALLLVSVLFLPLSTKNGVTAGAGDGRNEKITTVEDLLGMLYCIGNGGNVISANGDVLTPEEAENVFVALIAFSVTQENKGDSDKPQTLSSTQSKKSKGDITEYDFDSFTVHEYANVTYREDSSSSSSGRYEYYDYYNNTTEYYSYGSQTDKYNYTSLNRRLSIYVTEDATYYRSVGRSTTKSSYNYSSYDDYTGKDESEDESDSNYVDFDMEFYFDFDEDEVYIKVNYFFMSSDNPLIFSDEIIGKWIFIDSSEFVNILSAVNGSNLSALSEISGYIGTAYEEGELKNKTKTQTLDKSDFDDLIPDSINELEIRIDLSDEQAPSVGLSFGSSFSDSNNQSNNSHSTNYSYSIDAKIEATYTFENIDNTVVSMSKKVKIFEIDEDEIEDYIFYETSED